MADGLYVLMRVIAEARNGSGWTRMLIESRSAQVPALTAAMAASGLSTRVERVRRGRRHRRDRRTAESLVSRAGRRTSTRHVAVMGVSGVGKSAVAGRIAPSWGSELADGDDFRPLSNIAKMKQGIPLDDADRRPWLECLTEWTAKRADAGVSTVLACSALRRSYRDALRRADPDTYPVHPWGTNGRWSTDAGPGALHAGRAPAVPDPGARTTR